jgi:hypothetical protein
MSTTSMRDRNLVFVEGTEVENLVEVWRHYGLDAEIAIYKDGEYSAEPFAFIDGKHRLLLTPDKWVLSVEEMEIIVGVMRAGGIRSRLVVEEDPNPSKEF